MSLNQIKEHYAILLIAALLGGGGAVGMNAVTDVRYDAWTSKDATEAHKVMTDRMEDMRKEAQEEHKLMLEKMEIIRAEVRQELHQLQSDVRTVTILARVGDNRTLKLEDELKEIKSRIYK